MNPRVLASCRKVAGPSKANRWPSQMTYHKYLPRLSVSVLQIHCGDISDYYRRGSPAAGLNGNLFPSL